MEVSTLTSIAVTTILQINWDKMLIQRKSILTGKINEMELKVTPQQMERFYGGHELTQTIFPHLTAEEREFLISGMIPTEWNTIFN